MSIRDPERLRQWKRDYYARNREKLREQDRQRRLSYGRDCLNCGARTDGSSGRAKAPLYCSACAPDAYRVWTREAIIEAIRTYAARYGRPPAASDFNPAQAITLGHPERAQRFTTDGDYPSTTSVVYVFGYWSAAIAAAGFKPRSVGRPRS